MQERVPRTASVLDGINEVVCPFNELSICGGSICEAGFFDRNSDVLLETTAASSVLPIGSPAKWQKGLD